MRTAGSTSPSFGSMRFGTPSDHHISDMAADAFLFGVWLPPLFSFGISLFVMQRKQTVFFLISTVRGKKKVKSSCVWKAETASTISVPCATKTWIKLSISLF